MFQHYELAMEADRLSQHAGLLERERTQGILMRYLPAPPATILDVGGGAGVYACPLASLGYTVHLLDPVPLHVEQALDASRRSARPLASATVGEARELPWPAASADAVLLLGPLYHLTKREERVRALREARRVLRPGGMLFAAAISRFASLVDGLWRRFIDDPAFQAIVEGDLHDGQHRNPSANPMYFTTAFFHHPEGLRAELSDAGLQNVDVLAVEGVGWMLPNLDAELADAKRKERLLSYLRRVEREPSLLGASAHLIAIGQAG
jgi:ubiquinone/menaquinone biosynthesis C-methylase UbiE